MNKEIKSLLAVFVMGLGLVVRGADITKVSATASVSVAGFYADGSSVDGALTLGYAPTERQNAVVKVGDDAVVNASEAGRIIWTALTNGEYTIVHRVGDISLSATYNVIWTWSTISYINLKGATHSNPSMYQEGAKVTFSSPSAVTGYTFAGWTPSAITADMTGSQTVRANWTANTYTIKYDANGGKGTTASTSCTYDTYVTLAANGFTRSEYKFLGWATEKDGDVAYSAGESVKNLVSTQNGSITLYAVWEYARYLILYRNLKGASNSNPSTYLEGTRVTFTSLGSVVGYAFAGWTPSSITADMTGNQIVTANWTPNTYTIKYDGNGGSGTTDATSCTYDEDATLAANSFTRRGYKFAGWATEKDGEVVYAAGASVRNLVSTQNGSITLYAVWEASYCSITYANLKGATHSNPSRYQEGTSVTFSDPSEVVGYKFAGWSPSSITWSMSGNQTVTAKWTANTYTIKYDANGGEGTVADQSCTYDEDVVIADGGLNRSNCKFIGWAMEKEGAAIYVAGEQVKNLVSEQNGSITLYAVWEKLAIEISDLKVTPVVPWGVVIDYTMGGVTESDAACPIEVTMDVGGTDYTAKNLLGATNCVNGVHRVYWNIAADGLTADLSNAKMSVAYWDGSWSDLVAFDLLDMADGVSDGLRCVLATGAKIDCELEIGYVPTEEANAIVFVDDEVLVNAKEVGHFTWYAPTAGVYVVSHSVGADMLSATYVVTNGSEKVEEKPNPPMEVVDGISLGVTEFTIKAEGGNQAIAINGNGEAWTGATSEDWLSLLSTSGTATGKKVLCAVEANTTAEPRVGYVYIAGLVVKVIQEGCGATLDKTAIDVGSDGGEETVSVVVENSMAPWMVCSDVAWISIVKREWTGSGNVVLKIAPWNGAGSRTGTVTIAGQTVTVTQTGATLTYPTKVAESVVAGGQSGTFTIMASKGVVWTVTSDADWLVVDGGSASRRGDGTVAWTAKAQTTLDERKGTIIVTPATGSGFSSWTFVVTQEAATVDLSVSIAQVSAQRNTVSVNVSVADGVKWKIEDLPSWVSLSGSADRVGSGAVALAVVANPKCEMRSATFRIAGKEFSITQKAAQFSCPTETETSVVAEGGSGTLSIAATDGVGWRVTSSASWLTVANSWKATYGNGTVSWTAQSQAALGETRTATITVRMVSSSGDKTWVYTVTQTAATASLSDTRATVAAKGGDLSVDVETASGVNWTIAGVPEWITLDGETNRTGSKSVKMLVSTNETFEARAATLTIAGQDFVVTQNAAKAEIEGGAKRVCPVGGANLTISVRVDVDSAPWTVAISEEAKDDWIFLTAGDGTLMGDGTFSLYIDSCSDESLLPRTATVTVANQVLTILQTVDCSQIAYMNLKGATNPNPMSYQKGMSVTFANPGTIVGYTFAGWSPSAITPDMEGDLTVIANWKANSYTIKYDANGGEGMTESTDCIYDADAEVAANSFTRENYEFIGWAMEKDGEIVYAAGTKVKNLVSEQDGSVTLYAVWERIPFAISNLKVTPIEPLGVAIDYTVCGATKDDVDLPIEVFMTVGGTNIVATTLVGETNCVNGVHRIYWNIAADGLALDTTDASVTVTYGPDEGALYCVVDLSAGAGDGVRYPVVYLDASPDDGFSNEVYKTTKLVLKRVNVGTFIMGEDQTDDSHRVTLTKPFYMGLFEVTQKQWELVMGANPCSSTSYGKGGAYPVHYVSYNMIRGSSEGAQWPAANSVDSDSFLGKLRARTGVEFDLPTEAQWEYTCRAGTMTTFSYGDSANGDYMWYGNNSSSSTHEVGTKLPNDWGFYDMHGNVWEWCLDWYGDRTYGADPYGPSSGTNRMLRGGYFNVWWAWVTSTCQLDEIPSSIYRSNKSVNDDHFGLRLAGPGSNISAASATVANVECRVIADGSGVKDSLTLGAVPTDKVKAVVKVDDEVVIDTSVVSTTVWRTQTREIHTVTHTVADTTISASYLMNANLYTIKYDANGGEGTIEDTTCTYDVDAEVAAGGFTRENYDLIGWATEKGGDVVYALGAMVQNIISKQDASITLYAVWKRIPLAISDLKVTPIEPLGVAIDYTVRGAMEDEAKLPIEVSMTVDGKNTVATTLAGETNCVNGAHRIYWNMAADGFTMTLTNVEIFVRYAAPRYCVIDLSQGTNATSYSVSYCASEPNGGFTNEIYKTTKLVLKRVDAGSFIMGEDQTDESHRVTLTNSFYMGIFEVTQKQWELVMGPSASEDTTDGDMKPIESVTYGQICSGSKFRGKLCARTGIDFGLPTGAQWEYACRAGTTTMYSYGDEVNGDYMWYRGNSSSMSHDVGLKLPNGWGFYDMHGNASEWCSDWVCDDHWVIRGGNWSNSASYCASASWREGDSGYDYTGFRLCRTFGESVSANAVSAIIINGSSRVIAEGAEVEGSLILGAAPMDKVDAVVKVDGEVAIDTSVATTTTWQAQPLGEHVILHMVGDTSISANYEFVKHSSISYTNLKGAANANPTMYKEGTESSFVNPGAVVGYTFAGWTPSAITAGMTGPQTVMANWTANRYTIKYNANGGSGTTGSTSCTYDADAEVSTNGFVRENYEFMGWAKKNNGAVVYAPGTKVRNLSSKQGGSVTLYAVWKRIPFALSNLKVTPIEPLGVAIDYMVRGATEDDVNLPIEVFMTVGGTNYVAVTLAGETNCTNGAHRIYWNMAADGLTLDTKDATVTVRYGIGGGALYCVVDLLSGAGDGVRYPVVYLDASPDDGFSNEVYKTTKVVLKRVDAGTFIMGEDQTDESHRVTLTKPFYMGLFEVTQRQWELVMGSNPCSLTSYGKGDAYPVHYVSYDMIRGSSEGTKWPAANSVDSDSFLGKLRARTGVEFDLPTEAQWEYTCRAGTTTTFSYGGSANGDYMWYGNNSSHSTHKVGTKKPNPWGFYDVHGNVWEWCLDWSGDRAYGTDPNGPSSGSKRMLRGGYFNVWWAWVTSACQINVVPSKDYADNSSINVNDDHFGLRLVGPGENIVPASAMVSNVECRVIAEGSEVEGSLIFGAVPTNKANAVVSVDGEVVVDAAELTNVVWKAKSLGKHTISHTASGVMISAVYVVKGKSISYTNLKGATHSNPSAYLEGVAVEFSKPSEVVGYTFAGWLPSAITVDMTGDLTVEATWKANTYTIKYDANGGEGTTDATMCTYDADAEVSHSGFTLENHKFIGWADEPGGDVVYTPGEKVRNLASKQGASVTLYAVWKRIPLIVSDLKVTSIESLGLAIDYMVRGATNEDKNRERLLEVALSANGTNYAARTLVGATNCVNGAHRVYWNMAADGLVGTLTNAELLVRYAAPRYCVVDLLQGTNATSYFASEPEGGFTNGIYKTRMLVLKRVPAGSFVMGSNQSTASHRVTLTKPFYLGLYETTQAQWELVMRTNLCASTQYGKGDDYPVHYVSYDMIRGSSEGAKWPATNSVDATSFLGKLREETGLVFDLPTEAQWEYTCRAGTTTSYNYGKSEDGDSMWYKSNSSASSHIVGTKNANPWGFYDMHGNVREWCLDWYGTLAYGEDPNGVTSGLYRVVRDGSWYQTAPYCRSAYRNKSKPALSSNYYSGFRLALTLGKVSGGDELSGLEDVSATATGIVCHVEQGENVVISDERSMFIIPTTWFETYPTLGGATVAEWQTIAEGAGVKTDAGGAAMPVWQDYVAGTDPTNALSKLTAKIEIKDGEPVVTWSPALNGEGVREGPRRYRVWGKANLEDAAWSEVAPGAEAAYRFFRVTVEMP